MVNADLPNLLAILDAISQIELYTADLGTADLPGDWAIRDSATAEIPFWISIAHPCRIAQGRMQFAPTRFRLKTALG